MARRRFTPRRKITTRYGKPFTTRKGKLGRYKYVNGRRVAFSIIRKARTKRKRY